MMPCLYETAKKMMQLYRAKSFPDLVRESIKFELEDKKLIQDMVGEERRLRQENKQARLQARSQRQFISNRLRKKMGQEI